MKLLRLAATRQEQGVVQVILHDVGVTGPDGVFSLVLSSEAARNLAWDLNESAGVADLENEEWKAGRTEDPPSLQPSNPSNPVSDPEKR